MPVDKDTSILTWLNTTWGRFWAIIASGMALSTLLVNLFHWEAQKVLAVVIFGCLILIIAGVMIDKRSQQTRKQLDEMQAMLTHIRKDTLRIQLSMTIQSQPTNIDTILTIAEVYFVEMHGDWVATNEFMEWARVQNVTVPIGIANAIEKNERK